MEKKEREIEIVVAVDKSEESMYALSWCIANLISPTQRYNLLLLYVKPYPLVSPSFQSAGFIFSKDAVAALEKCGEELADSVMERAEAICSKLNATKNMNIERVVLSGDAKDVICSAVEKLEAHALVMGSHGYGFFKRALLGSVSDYCAKHAQCPVVIVKHP